MGHKSMSDGMGPKEGRPAGTLVGVAEVDAVEVRQQWEGGRRRPAGGGGQHWPVTTQRVGVFAGGIFVVIQTVRVHPRSTPSGPNRGAQ